MKGREKTLLLAIVTFCFLSADSNAAKPAAALPQKKGTKSIMVNVYRYTDDVISMDYLLPEPEVTVLDETVGGTNQERVTIGNAILQENEGEPVLPVVPSQFIIPPGKTIDKIKVIRGKAVKLAGKHMIDHGRAPIPFMQDIKVRKAVQNPIIYNSDKPFPDKAYELVSIQRKRGVAIAIINLYPATYYPKSGRLYYCKTISLQVTTKPDTKTYKLRTRPDDTFLLKMGLENPEALLDYQVRSENNALKEYAAVGICDPADSYEYVIITKGDMANVFTDLLTHKQSLGLTTQLVTTEDIYAESAYQGVDDAETIRNFIIDAYNNWETNFILLGGDANIIPVRFFYCKELYLYIDDIPSDLYYQCLDYNFNSDGDERWGERDDGPDGADVDLLSEVYIGRASAENQAEMSNFVLKTLAYEQLPASDPYLSKAIICGEHLGWGGVSEFAKPCMEEIRLGSDANGFTSVGFQTNGDFDVDVLYDEDAVWDASTLIGMISSNDYSIINHLGHGWEGKVMKLVSSGVDALSNSKPLFLYTQACLSGAFDKDCIAEWLTNRDEYGFFGGVLNARYGFGYENSTDGPSQRYARHFWDAFFDKKIYNAGAINAYHHEVLVSRINQVCMRWCYYETNLFCDPQTMLRGLPTDPRIIYTSFVIDDQSGGNGDGFINPGEDIAMTIRFINAGHDATDGVDAILTSPDANITVTTGSASFPDFPGQGAQRFATYAFNVSSGCPTPYTVDLNLNITDAYGNSWPATLPLTVYTSCQVSGYVTTLTGGNPIENAYVEYSGPTSSGVSTDATGYYSFTGINGTYSISAKASGCIGSIPQEVTLPPSITDVNFELGYIDVYTDKTSITLTLDQNETAQEIIRITNDGDMVARYDIRYGLYPSEPDFSDGFENGLDNWILGDDQIYSAEVTTETAAGGSYSLKLTGGYGGGAGHEYKGLRLNFEKEQTPDFVSFAFRCEDDKKIEQGYFKIGPDYHTMAYFCIQRGYISVYKDNYTGWDEIMKCEPNKWYTIRFEIDWNVHNFDIYIDDILVITDYGFFDPISSFRELFLFSKDNSSVIFYDNIAFGAMEGMVVTPLFDGLQPGESKDITVDFDASNIVGGSHSGYIYLDLSKSGIESSLEIPCNLTVTSHKYLAASPTFIDFDDPLLESKKINFKTNFFPFNLPGPNGITPVDIDKDGDIDILASGDDNSQNSSEVAWFENIGSGDYVAHTIYKNPTQCRNVGDIKAVDLDKDGDIDVMFRIRGDSKIVWYENDGSQTFFERVITDAEAAYTIFPIDLDLDGDIDIVSGTGETVWYENDGMQQFTRNSISATGARSVYAVDMDGDNDIDIVSEAERKIYYHENTGSETFTDHEIPVTRTYGLCSIKASDIDSDGDMDVLLASCYTHFIAWYENNGSQTFTEHMISTAEFNASEVSAVDFDNDGDIDILGSIRGIGKVAWYENDGNQLFTHHIISLPVPACYSISAFDLDQDGDLDVLAAHWDDDRFVWYESDRNSDKAVLRLTNDGNTKALVSAINIDNPDFNTTNELPLEVPPLGGTVEIEMVYSPSAPEADLATMSIINDSYNNPSINVTLFGDNSSVIPYDLVIRNQTISGNKAFLARNNITAGELGVTVQPPANVYFASGNKITLIPGFSVDNGARFRAYIDTDLANP